jgi:hypothetical protein
VVENGGAFAEHDDGIAGHSAIGAGAQSPPHAKRIHDRHPCATIKQSLDEALGRVGLTRAGGADDGNAIIERIGRKSGRQIVLSDGRDDGCSSIADPARDCMRSSSPHGWP